MTSTWSGSPCSHSCFVTSARAQLFTSGAALLFILLIFPGGLGQVVYNIRDFLLRKLAAKHDIVVPSLVADIRVEAESSLPGIAEETIPMPAAAADHVHAATTRRRR